MKKLRVLISALVVVLLVIVSFVAVVNPTTSVVFRGNIMEASSGEYTFVNNNTTYTSNYVDIMLTYSLPVHLDPNRLNFTLAKQNGTFTEPDIRNNGSSIQNVSLEYVNLTYSSGYPHILTIYYMKGLKATSTEIHGEIYNPNGVQVGNAPSVIYQNGSYNPAKWIAEESYVQSGAIVNLSLGNLPLSGLVLTLHYTGAAGTSSIILS